MLIIKNTTHIPQIQILIIKENPQISTYLTTQENVHTVLKKLLRKYTSKTHKKVTIKEPTLYHDNKPIKTYKNTEYLQLICQNLTKNPYQTLQQAHYKAQQKYYQHITYDKHNRNYKLTINNQTISTHKKLTHVIQEKQIRQKNTQEEETLCQKQDTNIHTNNTRTTNNHSNIQRKQPIQQQPRRIYRHKHHKNKHENRP